MLKSHAIAWTAGCQGYINRKLQNATAADMTAITYKVLVR